MTQRPNDGLWLEIDLQRHPATRLLVGPKSNHRALPDGRALVLHTGPHPVDVAALVAWLDGGCTGAVPVRQGFSAVIVSANRDSLVAAVSSRAEISLFFVMAPGQITIGSLMADLVRSMSRPPALNEGVMADLVALHDDPRRTPFERVERLPTGHRLEWSVARGVHVNRWFDPASSPLRHLRGDEAERMREAVRSAVEHSLPGSNGVVAATLSGGLDSTMVTATAADLLRGSGQLVHAAAHVPLPGAIPMRPGYDVDDGPYVEAFREAVAGVAVTHLRNTDRITPVEEQLRLFPMTYLPVRNPANLVWMRQIQRWAGDLGASVLLTGAAGNAPFSRGAGGILRHMMRTGQLGPAVRFVRARARAEGLRPAVRSVAGAAAPDWALVARARLGSDRRSAESYFTARMPIRWDRISADARKSLAGMQSPTEGLRREAWVNFVLRDAPLGQVPQATNEGAWWSDPLSDPEVMTLALSLPDEAWVLDGRDRSLARRAAEGLVPDPVRLRTSKGEQSADLGLWVAGRESVYSGAAERVAGSTLVGEFLDREALLIALTRGLPEPGMASARWDITTGRALGYALFACWWEDERRSLGSRSAPTANPALP